MRLLNQVALHTKKDILSAAQDVFGDSVIFYSFCK